MHASVCALTAETETSAADRCSLSQARRDVWCASITARKDSVCLCVHRAARATQRVYVRMDDSEQCTLLNHQKFEF